MNAVENTHSAFALCGVLLMSRLSPQLVADHTRTRLRRLGLGGLASLTDIDLEDVGKCAALEWLELRACAPAERTRCPVTTSPVTILRH